MPEPIKQVVMMWLEETFVQLFGLKVLLVLFAFPSQLMWNMNYNWLSWGVYNWGSMCEHHALNVIAWKTSSTNWREARKFQLRENLRLETFHRLWCFLLFPFSPFPLHPHENMKTSIRFRYVTIFAYYSLIATNLFTKQGEMLREADRRLVSWGGHRAIEENNP